MEYFVKITGSRDFYIEANGKKDFSAKCTKQSDGTYLFEYEYFVYTKGGGDKSKVKEVSSIVLTPGKKESLWFKEVAYDYVLGCYNKAVYIYVELMTGEQLYEVVKRTPSYKYGKLLLSLDKKDEFIKLLNSFEEPSNDIWSIYDLDKYEMLALAYQNGIGREINDKLAVLNAFRGSNLALISSFIELGYGKNTLKNPEFFIEELEGISSNADYYLRGTALIEEGFISAGEYMMLWGSECEDSHNNYGFYNEGNYKAWYYQSLLYKSTSSIYFNRGKLENAISDYGKYLLYKKQGNFDNLFIKEWVNEGDQWESDWQEHIGYNHKLLKELVVEAANNNDDYAKKLLS